MTQCIPTHQSLNLHSTCKVKWKRMSLHLNIKSCTRKTAPGKQFCPRHTDTAAMLWQAWLQRQSWPCAAHCPYRKVAHVPEPHCKCYSLSENQRYRKLCGHIFWCWHKPSLISRSRRGGLVPWAQLTALSADRATSSNPSLPQQSHCQLSAKHEDWETLGSDKKQSYFPEN